MYGPQPYMAKLMSVFGMMEHMMGPQFDTAWPIEERHRTVRRTASIAIRRRIRIAGPKKNVQNCSDGGNATFSSGRQGKREPETEGMLG